jgi:Thioesterase domain
MTATPRGGGFYSRQLSRAIGIEQPFYVVHPHGIDGSQVPETIEGMAADRTRSVRLARPRGPYVLGGHCNGALVALEMARQLVREGEAVPVVVMLDVVAPWRHKRVWPPEPADTSLAQSPREAGESPPVNDVFARYKHAIAAYRPAPYPGRIAVLRSVDSRDFRRSLGWSLSGETVETCDIPGNHIPSLTRHVAATGARIAACLEDVFNQGRALSASAAERDASPRAL